MIGLGVVTYNRPDYLKRVLDRIEEHLMDVVDIIWLYNDGSIIPYDLVYPKGVKRFRSPKNKGVGTAKNWLFRKLLAAGCDYIFILEDDILVKSPKAITGYIEASQQSGIQHLMFAKHGALNQNPIKIEGLISYYLACVGAYTFYTRECLEKTGLMDEKFFNAWEHVEHTWRCSKLGFNPWPLCADAKDSAAWLEEIPGSTEKSVIGERSDHKENIEKATKYWLNKDPDCPIVRR